MMSRLDFIKQLDILTQQEIKNFQNSISSIFEMINSINEKIDKNQKDNSLRIAKLESNIQGQELKIEDIKTSLKDDVKKLYRLVNDQSDVSFRNHGMLNSLVSDLNETISYFKKSMSEVSVLSGEVYKNKDHLNGLSNLLKEELSRIVLKTKSEIEKVKKDIISRPSDVSKIKIELEEKIHAHTLDVAGVMKELTYHKRECFVLEKKIENIYTLIKRMQEKG